VQPASSCSFGNCLSQRHSHRPKRAFDIPDTMATHLRLEVMTNQCTGTPDYAGEQDADPRANTDCSTASPQALNVRAAEFQAFVR
jgi:hypothetical protein